MKISSFLPLILFYFLITSTQGCFISKKWRIYVIDDIPNDGSPSLTLHCASGDDDLGFHTLKPRQVYDWSFCESVLGNTLFFCHVWWNSKQVAFDAFKSKFLSHGSRRYHWSVRKDGIYFSYDNVTSNFVKKFDWK